MQFVVIINLEKEVAKDLNKRNRDTCNYKPIGLYIKAPHDFSEFNMNSPELHGRIQSRVFYAHDIEPGQEYTIYLEGYAPVGPLSVPEDKEFEIVTFPNKQVSFA